MPYSLTRNTTSDSLLSLLRSALVLAHLVLEITALPDADSPSPCPYSSSEEHNRHHRHLARDHNDDDDDSDVMLRCTSALVRRATVVARSHGHPRLSGQALAAIVLGATIVFCALLGCLLQLPIACSSLRTRLSRSDSTEPPDGSTLSTPDGGGTLSTSSGGASMPGLFDDVEMMVGDQRRARATMMSRLASPPPPYSRAPSYENSEELDGRGGSTS